jgi:hypothetical protein
VSAVSCSGIAAQPAVSARMSAVTVRHTLFMFFLRLCAWMRI